MDDRFIMENILMTSKSLCDIYMHGSIESGTPNIHEAFKSALGDTLCIQNSVYGKMSGKGWYTEEQVPSQKITAVKQKYTSYAV